MFSMPLVLPEPEPAWEAEVLLELDELDELDEDEVPLLEPPERPPEEDEGLSAEAVSRPLPLEELVPPEAVCSSPPPLAAWAAARTGPR